MAPGRLAPGETGRHLSELADALVTTLWNRLHPDPAGRFAIVGLGALGRRELAPEGDGEVLFLHDEAGDAGGVLADAARW